MEISMKDIYVNSREQSRNSSDDSSSEKSSPPHVEREEISESRNRLPRLAYSVRETAVILGVCEKTVRRLISRGLLKSSSALRHILIPKKEIERFLEDTVI
jgi:excisionase family DNA binding protein